MLRIIRLEIYLRLHLRHGRAIAVPIAVNANAAGAASYKVTTAPAPEKRLNSTCLNQKQ
jgi:hypothetical protein